MSGIPSWWLANPPVIPPWQRTPSLPYFLGTSPPYFGASRHPEREGNLNYEHPHPQTSRKISFLSVQTPTKLPKINFWSSRPLRTRGSLSAERLPPTNSRDVRGRRQRRSPLNIRRSTFSVLSSPCQDCLSNSKVHLGRDLSLPPPLIGHASAAGLLPRCNFFHPPRLWRLLGKIFGPILAPTWPPRSPS